MYGDREMSEEEYMGNLYQKFPVTIHKGSGARVWDDTGREYIDCMGGYGVALVGHRNKRVVNALQKQLGEIITVHSSLYSTTRLEFLKKLFSIAPSKLSQVHLNNSGAESVEAAIKFARKYTKRKRMVAMRGSYHGKTMGALSLTFNPKYRKSFEPLVDLVEFVPFGDIDALQNVIDDQTAMLIIEPIQGESGIHVAPNGFLQKARSICDDSGTLLVFDEIQCGLGRTGRMWACEHWDTIPDILCASKGIAGGIPMGVTLTKPEIIASISKGEHSSTFGGNPLACAAAKAAITALTDDGLVKNAASVGAVLIDGLKSLASKHPIIREVRGMGLMVGVELKFDVREILLDAIKNGMLLLYSGRNVLRFLPPLSISKEEVQKVLVTLDELLTMEEKRRDAN
ncbi:MAG: acetylornithine and succinylornithine aminotransferase [Cenarchaeum symbiont of Oopsacas minuta]|nr:acetylornithine and succinylornithine aminotransferase [Cenarchaeum symbiont of Oopsacas minuta]